MELITRLVFSAIVGFISHIFWYPSRRFEQNHGARWASKLRHAIGIITIAVPQAAVCDALEMPRGKTRNIVATLLTGLAYGGGNFIAHLLDSNKKKSV